MFLNHKIKKWREAGIITDEIAQKLMAFEEKNISRYGLHGILGVGAFAIVIGIISTVSANWEAMSVATKLVANFLCLILLSFGCWKCFTRSKFWFEVFIFILFGSFLATIAHIGQSYHLGGHIWLSLATWLAISTPLVLFSRVKYTAYAWAIFLLLIFYSFCGETLRFSFENMALYGIFFVSYWFFVFKKFERKEAFFSEALFKLSIIGFFILFIFLGTLRWHNSVNEVDYMARMILIGTYIPLLWPIVKNYNKEFLWVSVVGVGYIELPLWIVHKRSEFFEIWGALYFVLFFGLLAYTAIKNKHRKTFNFAIVLIGLRILVVYFEVFGNLLKTGLGLVATGGIILLIGYIFRKILIQKETKT